MSGNSSKGARIDNVIYEGVRIAGAPLTMAQVQDGGGVGEYHPRDDIIIAAGNPTEIYVQKCLRWVCSTK